MNAQGFLYAVCLAGPQQCRETPPVIGQKFLETLDALSAADPLFTPWKVLDKPAMAAVPLAAARLSITAIIEKNVVRNDNNEPEPTSGYRPIAEQIIRWRHVSQSLRSTPARWTAKAARCWSWEIRTSLRPTRQS